MNLFKTITFSSLLFFSFNVIADAPLEKRWELSGFMTPESVIYDETRDVLYVSNINGGPTDKDGNGFISKVSIKGELIQLKWVEGLDAPKGLAIHDGKLYVSDIDTLVEIDIEKGAIYNRYVDEHAQFLNDVTAKETGEIFVSDMATNKIHLLSEGVFSTWLEDEALNSPNGLHAKKENLIVATWGKMTDGFTTEIPGHIKTISYDDKTIKSLGDGTSVGNLDGIEPEQNNYLATDWMAGKLFRVYETGEAELLLELEQGMADHEWIESKLLILLPMMKNDKLLAYFLKP